MQDTHISLAHGNGGRLMRELITQLFAKHLQHPTLNTQLDATTLPWSASHLVITTDGFIVKPLEFAGGNIGSLAVHGTVNDLAVAGAKPLYLTLNVFIEEGLEIATLERVIISMAQAAQQAGVSIVAGDTKVVQRGEGGGLYLATTGVGVKIAPQTLDFSSIQAGDIILVSGAVGNHGIAVMLAREQFGLRGDLQSDSANVFPLTHALLPLTGLRFMRDPTRGGLATVAHEISQATGKTVILEQGNIPIHDAVQVVCDMLGYDPLYLACEGRVVAVVAKEQAEQALASWRALAQGEQAAIIGQVATGDARVILRTPLGGERLLEELEDDPLPRIC
ncbi:hydrogenase expression/formation protein HypE [Beggiatoa alba B18LD]|uniref:Hydrogenase expression/formation protein HypE n=1 Tax=Beggiatoa alba B18LD TaxID=395493 RepID=I3CHZ0_9GAMM|nr:hydrogenase expression/formation protein HypE [Beggiatoa alba]EIJ43233.1 hydrogenase expression/formation protein HypE [Beggiatoa alba B18LD]